MNSTAPKHGFNVLNDRSGYFMCSVLFLLSTEAKSYIANENTYTFSSKDEIMFYDEVAVRKIILIMHRITNSYLRRDMSASDEIDYILEHFFLQFDYLKLDFVKRPPTLKTHLYNCNEDNIGWFLYDNNHYFRTVLLVNAILKKLYENNFSSPPNIKDRKATVRAINSIRYLTQLLKYFDDVDVHEKIGLCVYFSEIGRFFELSTSDLIEMESNLK